MGCRWNTLGELWKWPNWKWPNPCFPTPPVPAYSASVIIPGVDATTLIQPWIIEPWNPYRAGEIKKKKKVRLSVKIGGREYVDEKEMKTININIDDINFIKSDSTINLNIKKYKEEIKDEL